MKKKQLVCALFALILALALTMPAFAAPLPMFVDEAGLLSQTLAADLDAKLVAMSEKYGCDTVILTVGSIGDAADMKEFMGKYYMDSDYGQGEKYDCLMLLVVGEAEDWRIACWGDAPAFTSAGLGYLGERLRGALASGGLAAALNDFAIRCEKFYAQLATAGKPYDEGSLPQDDSTIPAPVASILERDPDSFTLLVDEAGLLSEDEAAALLEKLTALSAKWKNDIAIVTVDSIGDASPMEFADDWFDYGGYGRAEGSAITEGDGLLLLLNMGERDWWISTKGYAITAFTDAGIEYLGDRLKADGLSSGDYANAFNGFAGWCDQFFEQAETGKPYDTGSLPQAKRTGADYAAILVVCFGAGALIASFVTKGMKAKLKTVRKKQQAADYMRPGSLQVIYANEQFLYKNVTRVKQESSSSSGGGGSSTHSSSSGSSHGGGGGKF